MGVTKKYKDHCYCMGKNIEVIIKYISDGETLLPPIRFCLERIPSDSSHRVRERIHGCQYSGSAECVLKNYS